MFKIEIFVVQENFQIQNVALIQSRIKTCNMIIFQNPISNLPPNRFLGFNMEHEWDPISVDIDLVGLSNEDGRTNIDPTQYSKEARLEARVAAKQKAAKEAAGAQSSKPNGGAAIMSKANKARSRSRSPGARSGAMQDTEMDLQETPESMMDLQETPEPPQSQMTWTSSGVATSSTNNAQQQNPYAQLDDMDIDPATLTSANPNMTLDQAVDAYTGIDGVEQNAADDDDIDMDDL